MIQLNKIGNAFHAFSSLSVLAYTITVMLFAKPGSGIFDSEWVEHGFCVVQKDVPHWNSHDLCLYFDTILVAIGLLIYQSLKGMPNPAMKSADEMMIFNLLGHLGHGIAHGFIATKYRGDDVDFAGAQHISHIDMLVGGGEEINQIEIVKHAVIGAGFWFGMLRGIVPTLGMTALTIASVSAYLGRLFVRDILGFAYVQAVIAVAFTSTQLMLPKEKKDFCYAAFAASSLVLSIIPWVESTACQNVAAKVGGHLIYDVSIAVLLIAAYTASWFHYSKRSNEKVD